MVVRATQQVVETLASGDGAVRTTQQAVEVLSIGDGAVRTTQQVVEVLSFIFEGQTAVSTLVLTDAADKVGSIYERGATSTLTLTDGTVVTGPTPLDANNTLAMTNTSDYTFGAYARVAENTIDLSISMHVSPQNLLAETPDFETDPPVDGFTDSWTQEPRFPITYEVSATSTIALTSEAPQPHGSINFGAITAISLLSVADNIVKTRHPSHTLAITQSVTADKIIKVSSTLVLTQTAVQGIIPLSAESTLDFTHHASSGPITRSSESTITLTQATRSSLRNLSASNDIALTQSLVVIRPWYLNPTNILSGITDDEFVPPGTIIPGAPFGLSQEVTLNVNPVRSVDHIIQLRHSATATHLKASGVDKAATTAISLTSTANLSETGEAISAIALTDGTIANLNTTDLGSSLDSLLSVAFVSVTRATISTADGIALKQSVAYSLIRDTTECYYTPFVGGSDADTVPPPTSLPTVSTPLDASIRFRLVYPPFGQTAVDTLDLRAPTFGNRERLEATRIQRETAGGTLTVFSDPDWPKVHSLQMQFSALKTEQARGLLDFLERWVGQEIGIYDYEGRYWKGVVLNPSEGVVQDGKCRFSASLEIEAERVVI